jgi:transcriptional regulator with XRE-family HTH domain
MSFARLSRDTRIALDVTQREVAAAVGISRSHLAGIEIGRVDPSLDLVWAIADRLGLELELVGRPPVVIDRRRGDLVHARCSAYVDTRMRNGGWDTRRELEIAGPRSHGWIDVLAYEPRSRTLVIIEVKTRLDDVGAVERQVSWYEREVPRLARSQGWRPRRTLTWLLCLASDEVEKQVAVHRTLLSSVFPDRAPALRAVVADGTSAAMRRGLALIDPTSRRRAWLISTRSDGRRSPSPFRDYAYAVRRLSR